MNSDLNRKLQKDPAHASDTQNRRLPGLSVGTVSFLNAAPLNFGIETELIHQTPARLAVSMNQRTLDGALLSITEVFGRDDLVALDQVAIASLGEVYSVFLASRRPVTSADTVYCDTASRTSVAALKTLLGDRGLQPRFESLYSYESAAKLDHVLLIGNPAIEFRRANYADYDLYDIGDAWTQLTGLPFVYAVWALKRNRFTPRDLETLRHVKSAGVKAIPQIVHSRTEYDLGFRQRYLGGYIRYDLGEDEKRGIREFAKLAAKHKVFPEAELTFV